MLVYERHLRAAHGADPTEYSRAEYSRALSATCKELGIKHTYAAIAAYVKA